MIRALRQPTGSSQLGVWLVVACVLALALFLGRSASLLWLALLAAAIGAALLLRRPALGLIVLVVAALIMPYEIGTGTEVMLNPATLLIPALLALWLLGMILRRELRVAPARVSRPLLLFLLAGLLSLGLGNATWDPVVPRSGNFLLVQLAQWAIFAFSAGAFWLTANLVRAERWLWRLTAAFLLVGGGVAILRSIPAAARLLAPFTTIAFIRAPFWTLLAALAGGQLLFNRALSVPWRAFLVAVLASTLTYAFVEQREAASNWVGIGAALGVLVWLRFPRLRWFIIVMAGGMLLIGVLIPSVYRFAGGDPEWILSGGSRLTLIERVVSVTLRNPITGLGPAAYRPYANMEPLLYQRAYWIAPQISSHNNFVDIFAHTGLLGLGLFLWFAVELGLLGLRLSNRYRSGFLGGYANGMLAAWVASLVVMMLADWILPFVYNIGFPGFQASLLVWLFLGGLVAIEEMDRKAGKGNGDPEAKQAP